MRFTQLRRSSWVVAILLSGALAYAPSFSGVFIFDDLPWIVDNAALQHLWPPWAAAGGTSRPLLFFTLAINHAVSGLEPWSYHLVNLGIHLSTALLLFGVIRRALGSERLALTRGTASPEWVAGSTALLWAVHPLATQAVTYVIQRGESLASLFMVLCIYALLRSTDSAVATASVETRERSRSGSPYRWWALIVISWWLAMATKEIAVTLPVLLVLFDVLILTGSFSATWRQRRGLILSLWAPIAVGIAALLALRPQHLAGLVRGDAETLGRLDYLISQPGVILRYLQLVIWPRSLQVDHGWPVADPQQAVVPILIVGVGLVLTLIGFWRRRSWSIVGVWFAAILAPTSSVVPLRDLLVEHRMYLPMVAPLLVLVLVLGRSLDEGRRRAVLMLAVAVLLVTTAARNRDYQSELSLWGDATQQTQNARRYYNLQLEFIVEEAGVLDGLLLCAVETAADLRAAARALQAGDASAALSGLQGEPSAAAANLRGLAFWMMGDTEAAAAQWDRPDALPAARTNLAVAYWLAGQRAAAEALLEAVCEEATRVPEAHYNLGTLRATDGRLQAARQPLERALDLRPTMASAMNNLGAVEEGLGAVDEAVANYDRALASGHETARLNRGLLHVRQRQYRQALPLLNEMIGARSDARPEARPDARLANARALARYFTGELEGATQDLQSAREGESTAALDNNLGCVQMALGHLATAQELFERALDQDPQLTAAHHNLGKLLVILDQPALALPHLRRAAAARPEDAVLAANLREAERLMRR